MRQFLSVIILVSALLIGCNRLNDLNEKPQPIPSATPIAWQYSEKTDAMTSAKVRFATIESNNNVFFKFPYEGGSKGQLMIRNTNGNNEVLFAISKGQFLSNANIARLRFDEEQPFEIVATKPSDGSSNLVFLSDEGKIVPKLQSAQKLKVEMTFYQEGNQVLEFDVRDLRW